MQPQSSEKEKNKKNFIIFELAHTCDVIIISETRSLQASLNAYCFKTWLQQCVQVMILFSHSSSLSRHNMMLQFCVWLCMLVYLGCCFNSGKSGKSKKKKQQSGEAKQNRKKKLLTNIMVTHLTEC